MQSPNHLCCLPLWFVDAANWHLTLIPHLLGHMVLILISPQVCKWVKSYIFTLSYKLTSHGQTNIPHMTYDLHLWHLTSWTCEGSYIISMPQVWFQLNFTLSNEANFIFWAHLTAWPLMIFDLGMTFDRRNIQKVTYCINKLWRQKRVINMP